MVKLKPEVRECIKYLLGLMEQVREAHIKYGETDKYYELYDKVYGEFLILPKTVYAAYGLNEKRAKKVKDASKLEGMKVYHTTGFKSNPVDMQVVYDGMCDDDMFILPAFARYKVGEAMYWGVESKMKGYTALEATISPDAKISELEWKHGGYKDTSRFEGVIDPEDLELTKRLTLTPCAPTLLSIGWILDIAMGVQACRVKQPTGNDEFAIYDRSILSVDEQILQATKYIPKEEEKE